MSLRLRYRITEASFKEEVVNSVKEIYGLDIGKCYVYSVLVSLKSKGFWIGPFHMIYDTGTVISLLPFRFFEELGIEKFAPIRLVGIVPEIEVPARLTRATLKFIDLKGVESPEIDAWVAIVERNDVPLIIGLKSITEAHDFIVNFKNRTFILDFY